MSIIKTPTEELARSIKIGVRTPLPIIRDPTRTVQLQHRMAHVFEEYIGVIVDRYNDFARMNGYREIFKKKERGIKIKRFAEEPTPRARARDHPGDFFEDVFNQPEIMDAQKRAASQMTDLIFDIRDTASRRVHDALRENDVRQQEIPSPARARARVKDTVRRGIENADAVAQSLARDIQETVIRHIDLPVEEEVQQKQLEQDILDQVDRARARAWQVTRTEVINAYNLFSVESALTHGIERFRWQSARGDPETPHGNVVCPVCRGFHNKVRLWGQAFGGNQRRGSYRLIFRPPAHPNCRCTLIPVLEAEIVPPEFLR